MEKQIAYCGLDCATCDAYLATLHNDQKRREETARKWSALNHVTILPEQINCTGCRADGVKTLFCERLCAVRRCAVQKGVPTCGLCEERPACAALAQITAHNPEALKNLRG